MLNLTVMSKEMLIDRVYHEETEMDGMALQDDAAVRTLAKSLMVVAEDRHRAATAVGGPVRPADWHTAKEEQVRTLQFPAPALLCLLRRVGQM